MYGKYHLCFTHTYQIVANPLVIVLGVIVHPHFGKSDRVLFQHVNARPPLVRRSFSEYMADMRTRHDLQRSTTHPSLKRKKKCITFSFPKRDENAIPWMIAPSFLLPKCQSRCRTCRVVRKTFCRWRKVHRPLWATIPVPRRFCDVFFLDLVPRAN